MKKQLFSVLFIALAILSHAQKFQDENLYGKKVQRIWPVYLQGLPQDTFALGTEELRSAAWIANKNGVLYMWNVASQKWKSIDSAGGGSAGAEPQLIENSILGRRASGTGPGSSIYTDAGGTIYFDGDTLKTAVSNSARAAGIFGPGDKTAALNTYLSSKKTIILNEKQIYQVTDVIDGQSGILKIENGASIAGGGTIRGVRVDASDVQQIFDTTIKAIGLQRASVAWWGARRDDANPRKTRRAIQLAIDAVATGGTLVIPADSVLGSSVYWLDSTLSIRNDIHIIGEGSILNPQTRLFWPPNMTCINIDGTGAKRPSLSNLWIQQASPITYDSTKHGIQSNTFINIDNVYFYNIAGDGIHVVANPPLTNADHSKIQDCYFNNCNNGIFLDGSDANIFNIVHNDFTLNRHWGYYSNGFLGNYLANNHFAENGKQNDVFVTYAGHTYFAINLIGISNVNHKPDVSTGYWERAVYDLSYPDWDSTKYYNSGGPYAAVNPNARERNLDSYLEAYQPRAVMPPNGFRDGGLHEDGGPKNGGNLDVVSSTILLGYDVAMKHNLQVNNTTQASRYEVLQFNSGYFFPKPEGIQGMTGQDGNLGFYQQGGIQFYIDSSTNRLILNNQPSSPTDSSKSAATTAQVMRAINARGGGGGGSSTWSQAGNNLINNNTGMGGAIVSSSLFLNVDAYPSSISNAYYISSGLSSAISARHIFGDGSGWKMVYAKRSGGTTTDLFTMQDNGNFDAVGSISSPLVLPNKLAVNSGTNSPTETAAFGLGSNNDIAIGTAAGNRYFHTGYADYGITAMNRRPSDGVYSNSSLGAVEYRMHSTGSGGTFEVGNYPAGSTAYTQRFFIDEAGNIGINNNSPSTMMDVAGMIRSSAGGFKFPDGTVQTTAATTSATPTLQSVTTAGNSTTTGAAFGSTVSMPQINLTSGASNVSLRPVGTGGNYVAEFPNKGTTAQTVAMLSDIISASTTDNNLTVSANVVSTKKAIQTLTDGATITMDASLGFNASVTLAGNRTLAISNAQAGQYYTIELIQDGTGSRTITLPSGSKVINGGAGAVVLSATGTDILCGFYDGTNYFWTIGKNYN